MAKRDLWRQSAKLPLAVAIIGGTAGGAKAAGPSFSCEKAATAIENAICADPHLTSLDVALDKAFRGALAHDPLGKPYLLEEQRAWLRSRSLSCSAAGSKPAERQKCLGDMFKTRLAAIESHDPRDTPMCRAIANTIRNAGGYIGKEAGRYLSEALSDDPKSLVRFDLDEKPLDAVLIAKLPKTADGDDVQTQDASIFHFGTNQSVFAVNSVQGTMRCQYISLFRIVGGGKIKPMQPPDDAQTECPTSIHFGSIDDQSRPALAVPLYVDAGYGLDASSIELWSRREDSWHHACTVEARYDTELTVGERFCATGAPCAALEKIALDAARAREALKDDPPKQLGGAPLMEADLSNDQLDLPTFGREPKAAYSTFESQAPVYRLQGPVGVTALRISHGTVGWRTDENWLVALYGRDGKELKPIAGFTVVKSRTKLHDVILK